MPGVLVMDQDGADRSKKLRDGSNEEGKPLTNGVKVTAQLDGTAEMPTGDTAPWTTVTNGAASEVAGQVVIPESLVDSWNQMPPELQHFEESYLPLSTLIERIAQQCYNGLEDTIEKMAEKPRDEAPHSGSPMVNGAGHHSATNGGMPLSKEDLRKRTLLMTFARDQRDRLIKLMVLTQWSRQVGDVSKLIDIWNWLLSQMQTHDEAANWIGQIKLNMIPMKQSNPDIKTALEVLTTGKAAWMPDLNYIPAKPLSAEQMLKTLRNLNALLSIRLNLHEDQPRHFKYSRIADGRATWVIPGEFEVDLSIVDEDPTSQFFFIDIRLLFSPAPEIPDFFRGQLELRVNQALKQRGLSGCHDTLHELVLTHKITILKQQASELSRRKWSDNLRIDHLHRSLAVQYWTALPGPKSWIEIGIASGRKKPGEPGWRNQPISHITIRWIRDGSEVKDIDLMRAISLTELSMEHFLGTIVKLHTLHLLRRIQGGLNPKDGSTSFSVGSLIRPKTPSDSPTYKTQLGPSSTAFTLAIEHVTGNLALRPVSLNSHRIQQEINQLKNRSSDAAHGIRNLLFSDLQSRIEKLTERKGWTTVRNLNLPREIVKASFKLDVGRLSVFRPPGWSQDWAIATTIDFSADTWWMTGIHETANGRAIKDVSRITGSSANSLSSEFLSEVERFAVASISSSVTRRELTRSNITSFLDFQTTPSAVSSIPQLVLYIKLSELLMMRNGQTKWAAPWVRLTYEGLERSEERVVHLIRGKMDPPLSKDLAALLTQAHNPDVAFHPDGGAFTILHRTPFGQPSVEQLKTILFSIKRLRNVAEALEIHQYTCEKLSLTNVVFTYPSPSSPVVGDSPSTFDPLRASITFSDSDSDPIQLSLDPTNPHRRVRAFLRALLSHPTLFNTFAPFASALEMSLPLLRALNAIEGRGGDVREIPTVHSRTLIAYRISYERPPIEFDVSLKDHRDTQRWHVHEREVPRRVQKPEHSKKLEEGLSALFNTRVWKGGGTGGIEEAVNDRKTGLVEGEGEDQRVDTLVKMWWGMRTGIVSTIPGIEDAIIKLDDVVRASVEGEGDVDMTDLPAGGNSGPNAPPADPEADGAGVKQPQAGRQVAGPKGGTAGAPGPKIKQEKNDVIELD